MNGPSLRSNARLNSIAPEPVRGIGGKGHRLSGWAGADCFYVPGIVDAETIGRLVKEVGAPVSVT